MEEFATAMGALSAYSMISSLISIAIYVLQALGMYTIAQRRGIPNAWLAWIPVGSLWILGSIADDYQLKVHGQVKNRRKTLMILMIVTVVLTFVTFGSLFGAFIDAAIYGDSLDVEDLLEGMVSMGLASLLLSAVGIAATVFQYICLYDLYASCDPNNKTLYLVLSIFVSVLTAIFTFVCRNKDDGMYAPQPVYGYAPPQYGQPYQQPPQYQPPQYQPPQYQPPQYQPPQYQQPGQQNNPQNPGSNP